jgi:hypothetical protein
MDASRLQVIERMLIIQTALLVSVVAVHAGALLVMRRVDVRAMALRGEVGFMGLMEGRALAGVLGVHGRMSSLMLSMDLRERASAACPITLALRSAASGVLRRIPSAAAAHLPGLARLLGARGVGVTV